VQVEAQYDRVEEPVQRNALGQVVQECQKTIEDFLNSIRKYDRHLSVAGDRFSVVDAVRKIQWRLVKSDELAKFRGQISGHIQRVELLLVTVQV